MENTFDKEYQWVEKIVDSSQNHQQLDCSRNCFTNFLNKHKPKLDKNPQLYQSLSEDFNELYYKKFLIGEINISVLFSRDGVK